MSGLGIQNNNDKNSSTRRPSTKTNAGGSTGVSASSQSSISQKDKNLAGG